MAKFEEKFIVINLKHIKSLPESRKNAIKTCIDNLLFFLEMTDTPDNKYYVCNQDEPYAKKVIDAILEGETAKENQEQCELIRNKGINFNPNPKETP